MYNNILQAHVVIMYLDAYKEHEKNKEMLITEDMGFIQIWGVCMYLVNVFYNLYFSMCSREGNILSTAIEYTTYDHTLDLALDAQHYVLI